MFVGLLDAPVKRLAGWFQAGPEIVTARDEDYLGCPVCDHPYARSNHMCIGTGVRIAS